MFISPTDNGAAALSKTAVVDKAGTVIVNVFELTLTALFFKALLVWDTNVSVAGSEEICNVSEFPFAAEKPVRFTVTVRDAFISLFTMITVIASAAWFTEVYAETVSSNEEVLETL